MRNIWGMMVSFLKNSDGSMGIIYIYIIVYQIILEKEMATHHSILSWRITVDRGAWRVRVHGVAKSQTRLK